MSEELESTQATEEETTTCPKCVTDAELTAANGECIGCLKVAYNQTEKKALEGFIRLGLQQKLEYLFKNTREPFTLPEEEELVPDTPPTSNPYPFG